jgi:hypothetical protein
MRALPRGERVWNTEPWNERSLCCIPSVRKESPRTRPPLPAGSIEEVRGRETAGNFLAWCVEDFPGRERATAQFHERPIAEPVSGVATEVLARFGLLQCFLFISLCVFSTRRLSGRAYKLKHALLRNHQNTKVGESTPLPGTPNSG